MKCDTCKREQGLARSCKPVPLSLHGVQYMPVRFGMEQYWNKPERAEYKPVGTDHCYECNVPYGGYHHAGCIEESCPVCGEVMRNGDCKCGW